MNNVAHDSLVDREHISLPPLHIKLGIMKHFVKALNPEGSCFKYIRSKFRKISAAKVHEGVFVSPDMRSLMKDDDFIKSMTFIERDAWLSSKNVMDNFLGNYSDPEFNSIVSSMLQNSRDLVVL